MQVGESAASLHVSAEIVLPPAAASESDNGDRPESTSQEMADPATAESPLRPYAIELSTSGHDRILTLHVPRPTVPAQLGTVESADWRRLGLALAQVTIREIAGEPGGR